MKRLLILLFVLVLLKGTALGEALPAATLGTQPTNGCTQFSSGQLTSTGLACAPTSGHGFIPFATGQLAGIVSNGQYFAVETPVALSLLNFVATAASFTCATNPTLTLEDCGATAGTCASPTALASVTLTAANTITASTTTFPVAVAQGHFLVVETTAGACTVLNVTGSAAY